MGNRVVCFVFDGIEYADTVEWMLSNQFFSFIAQLSNISS